MKKQTLVLLTSLLSSASAWAQQGTARLDSTFSADGQGYIGTVNDENVQASMIQSDDKIVITGYTSAPGARALSWGRLNADGSADTDFATNGFGSLLFSSLGIDPQANSVTTSVVELDNGKILMGGNLFYLVSANPVTQSFLLRLNSDGSLDTSFDTDGIYIFDNSAMGFYPESMQSLVALPNGEAVICGNYTGNADGLPYSYIQKLDASGAFTGNVYNRVNLSFKKIVSPDNGTSIIIAADSTSAAFDRLIKVDVSTMTLDASFGNNGIVEIDWSATTTANSTVQDLAINPDGDLVLLTYTFGAGQPANIDLQSYDVTDGSETSVSSFIDIATEITASTQTSGYKLGIDQITGDMMIAIPLPQPGDIAFLYTDGLGNRFTYGYFSEIGTNGVTHAAGYGNHQSMGFPTGGQNAVLAGFQSNGRPIISSVAINPAVGNNDYCAFRYNVLGALCIGFSAQTTDTDATCATCANGEATVSVTAGTGPFTYSWSNGSSTASTGNVLPGDYDVTVTDANGCQSFASVTVGFFVNVNTIGNDLNINLYPNPNQGVFVANIPSEFGNEVSVSVFNLVGEMVYNTTNIAVGLQEINLSSLPTGSYVVRFANAQHSASQKLSIVR